MVGEKVPNELPLKPRLTMDIGNGNKLSMTVETVSGFSDNINTSVSVTPIVTYDANNSFAYDTGATESFSFSFKRVSPPDADNDPEGDPTKWDNAVWIRKLTDFIDRWQTRTDGCTLEYGAFNSDGETNLSDFYPTIKRNVYIKSLSYSFPVGYPDLVTGSLSINTGSMTCAGRVKSIADELKNELGTDRITETNPVATGKMITEAEQFTACSSSAGTEYYPLMINLDDGDYNCISSYELKGGPTEPFQSLSLIIAKKRLTNLVPSLADDIKPGRNQIFIHTVGDCNMIVTKCKSSGTDYRITAYAFEEAYRGLAIGEPIECGPDKPYATPFEVITHLLDNTYEVGYGISLRYSTEKIKYNYAEVNNTWSDVVSFDSSSTVWYVLSVCAMRMGCTIWFQDGYVYIVDLTTAKDETTKDRTMVSNLVKEMKVNPDDTIDLKTYDARYLNASPYSPAKIEPVDAGGYRITADYAFCAGVIGTPDISDSGTDSLVNSVLVKYTGYLEENDQSPYTDYVSTSVGSGDGRIKASQERYGVRDKDVKINISGLRQGDAQAIADLYPRRLCDTQQTVTFTVSEEYGEGDTKRWQSYFPAIAYINSIIDHNTDTILTNRSNFKINEKVVTLYDKLMVSKFVRSFPDRTTEYTVGNVTVSDFTQTISTVLTAINNAL